MGIVGSFGAAVSADIPELTYEETSAGIRQIAKRSTNVRVSNWTFPNNNHIVVPGLKTDDPWMDVGIWMVPVDDTHTIRFSIYGLPPTTDEVRDRITRHMDTHADYEPAEHHEALFRGEYPTDPIVQLTSAQDYVATLGQGAIVDRPKEWLGRSDKGVAFLRRLFWRELDLLQQGSPTKKWERLPEAGNLQIMSSSA
jgi:5,5'-dehydrodivanillate O-demethylase